jgi:hypothetical protein
MHLITLLDHLRRTARCWAVVALALGGALLLPQQVTMAAAATPSAVVASPTRAPLPGPADQFKPGSGGQVECPPFVLTCDDVTIDPCIIQGDCTPPPPPPCDLGDPADQECPPPPPPCDTDHPDCPQPPCEQDTECPPPLCRQDDPECPPPPPECEVGDPECTPPPDTRPEPKPKDTDRPVPAKPTFTG